MKKKAVIIVTIICLTIIITTYYSFPSPIISNIDDVKIYHVAIIDSDYKEEDITSQIDCVKLVETISSYSRSKIRLPFAPTQITVGDIEIDGTDDNKTMHILLGNTNVIYESADKGGYKIHQSEQLKEDVLGMIQ